MRAPFVSLNSTQYKRLLNTSMVFGLLLWFLGLSYFAIKNQWGNDFSHFWVGSRTLLDGGDPYYKLFIYPETGTFTEDFHPLPWVAVIFQPLAYFPFPTANLVWAIINLSLLAISLFVVYYLGRKSLPIWGLCLICLATTMLAARTIACGQLGILILVACLLGLHFFLSEKWFLSGLWFGLVLIKPWIVIGTLLAIGVVALINQRWKFFSGFMVTCLSLIISTTILWPFWWENLEIQNYADSIGVWENGVLVEYWPLVNIIDFLHLVVGINPSSLINGYLFIVLILCVLSLGILTFYFWYKGKIPTMVFLGIFTVLGLLIVPYIRYYDYVVISFWLIGVFTGLREMNVNFRWIMIVAILYFIAVFINWGNHPEPWVYQMLLWLFLASILTIYAINRKINQSQI